MAVLDMIDRTAVKRTSTFSNMSNYLLILSYLHKTTLAIVL